MITCQTVDLDLRTTYQILSVRFETGSHSAIMQFPSDSLIRE